MPDPHITLGIAWALYFALHSILADLRVKHGFASWMGRAYRYYRLLYNGLAIGLLGILILYFRELASPQLFAFPGRLVLGGILAVSGLWIIWDAFKAYDSREFLGLSTPEAAEPPPLITSGWNAHVRHPLYFGSILFLLGYLLYAADLAALIMVGEALIYLVIGSRLEERKLSKIYGEAYDTYKQNVRMLIPYVI